MIFVFVRLSSLSITLGPSMLLQMALFHSSLWLSSIPLCIYITSFVSTHLSVEQGYFLNFCVLYAWKHRNSDFLPCSHTTRSTALQLVFYSHQFLTDTVSLSVYITLVDLPYSFTVCILIRMETISQGGCVLIHLILTITLGYKY